jgi:hypothetical protein
VGAVAVITSPELAPAAPTVVDEPNERLAAITQDQTQLIAQFDAGEAAQAAAQAPQEEEEVLNGLGKSGRS